MRECLVIALLCDMGSHKQVEGVQQHSAVLQCG